MWLGSREEPYRCLWGDGVWEEVPEAHALFPTCPGGLLVIMTLG